MAKEESIEDKRITGAEDNAPPSQKGKRWMIKWGIIGLVMFAVIGGGFFGWKVFSKKGGEGGVNAHPEQAAEADHGSSTPGLMIPLESFVVNLADSADIKYLKITINLEVDSQKSSDEVQARMPQIRDALLMLLTSKTSNDVKDIGGKLKLQDEMVARVNNYLKNGKLKGVYFTEFVMQ